MLVGDHLAAHLAAPLVADSTTVRIVHLVQGDVVILGGAVDLDRHIHQAECDGTVPDRSHASFSRCGIVPETPEGRTPEGVAQTGACSEDEAMASPKTVVSVDGHRIGLTHLEKVLYPETGTTKADVLDYYARIADVLIPHAADRPLTRKRWVDGVGTPERPGTMFFQKNLDASTPAWVPRRSIEHSDHSNDYPLLNDRATLTWLGQISAIELHVPQWRFGRTGVDSQPRSARARPRPGRGCGTRRVRRGGQDGARHPHRHGARPAPGHEREQGHPPVRGTR